MHFNDNLFLRAMLRAFRLTPPDSARQPLIPYFQYKIGPYRSDHYLYFRREPSWLRYKWEAFSKINSLKGSDVPRFLEFHYSAYPDKEDFRRFIRYEITALVAYIRKHPKASEHEYEVVLKWLEEKDREAAATTEAVTLQAAVAPARTGDMEAVEARIAEVMGTHAGNAVIDGQQHLDKFIQLLVLLKEMRAPGEAGNFLFTQLSTTDIAAILRQFKELKTLQTNTLQKKVTECTQALRRGDAKTEALVAALTDFFY
jgi:hypothetical protein